MLECLSHTISTSDADIDVVSKSTDWADFLAQDGLELDVALLDVDLCDDIPLTYKLNMLKANGVRTVLMSAASKPAVIRAALNGGALSYITRNEGPDVVIAALLAAGNGESLITTSTQALLDAQPVSKMPKLSSQELLCLAFVASGAPMKRVATMLGTTESTAKSYLKNLRAKYLANGIDIGCKTSLRARAIYDGILNGTW